MSERTIVLLAAWGRWSMAGHSKALGFAPVSPMFRDARPGRGYESSPPAGLGNGELLEVDAAVCALPAIPRIVVIQTYQQGGSQREIALRLGISHFALGRYQAAAHEAVENYLSGA